jgi:hypothetical protein
MIVSKTYAQFEFAPIGAKWWYNWESLFCQSGYCSYLQVTSEKDTLIDDISARKLKLELFTPLYPFDTLFVGNEYMYGNGDSVYHYNGSEFYLLYDFTVSAGDTLILNGNSFISQSTIGDDSVTFQVVIDSIGAVEISGYNLKVIYSHPNASMGYGGPVVQYIGDTGFFLGAISPSLSLLQFLRCYNDSILNYVDFSLPCDFTQLGTSLPIIEDKNLSVKVFPNPIDDKVFFEFYSPYFDSKRLTIFSTFGEKILDEIFEENTKDILFANYSPGKYYYQVFFYSSNKSLIGSFIKLK